MLRHDLVHHPPLAGPANKAAVHRAKAELETTPLQPLTEEELQEVRTAVRGASIGVFIKCLFVFRPAVHWNMKWVW